MALHQPSAALHLLVALLGLADPTVHRMLRLQRVASGNHVLLLLLPRRRRLRLVLDLWLEGQKANLRAFSVADPAPLRSRRAKGDAKRGARRTWMEASACSRSGQALSRFDASFVRPVIAGLHCMIYRLVPWPTLRFAKYKGDAGRQTASDEKLVSFSGSL